MQHKFTFLKSKSSKYILPCLETRRVVVKLLDFEIMLI
ncbi:hypothetical protein B0I21_10554 [Sphingobacterium paludis]|uniref:Uncharacterized protein n=1 Tax=Sphingobacterium paludis TaxID=1476465 RepID=A0A4R7CWN6_9SPHI|nr:hypothetical protein B0I21_10554 [Sphingobacterium paludis]